MPDKPKPGDNLDWSPEDLDVLSQITPADLKSAEALWRKAAPAPLRDLLQATPEEPDA